MDINSAYHRSCVLLGGSKLFGSFGIFFLILSQNLSPDFHPQVFYFALLNICGCS